MEILGAVGMTSTYALTNATLPYVLKIANKGYPKALDGDMVLQHALNLEQGKIIHPALKTVFK